MTVKEKIILDGSRVASAVKEELKSRVENLKENGITPCLATVLVGDDPSSATYVKMKGNACERLGILSKKFTFLMTPPQKNYWQQFNH